jgi:ribosomal protein S18 acetylase RimI-like enzyme
MTTSQRSATASLRPIVPADTEFLRALYATTRADELALVGWDDVQKSAFVRQQFDAQDRYYRQQFPDASFRVVLVDGQPAGRLYVADDADQILVIDVALMPRYRGSGIGSALLAEVLRGADDERKPVTLHVERNNRALAWYERLGFTVVEDHGVYLFLRREPPEVPEQGS